MRSILLLKTIVFYLMLGVIFLLAGDRIVEWIALRKSAAEVKDLYFYKDLVLLVAMAFVVYFSIWFYQKNKKETALNYQKLFHGSPYAIYVMEKETLKILAVNEAMSKLYGYTEQEFLSMSTLDIRPENEQQRIREFLSEYGESINESGVWMHKKKNGECFYVQITFHSVPLFEKDTYLVMVMDIDKSIKDEKKINDLLHLYETVNRATNDVIWDYDLIGDTLYWMQGYKEAYGYEDGTSPNNFWAMPKVYIEDRQKVIDSFRKVISNKQKSWFAEYRYVCADSSVKYIADRGYVIFNEKGEPIRMIGAMQDVDRQKKYEQQLLSQNEQLKEIAWINSHEVRRPLSNILGLVNLIRYSVDDKEELVQLIELLDTSARELNDAVVMINRQTMEDRAVHL